MGGGGVKVELKERVEESRKVDCGLGEEGVTSFPSAVKNSFIFSLRILAP